MAYPASLVRLFARAGLAGFVPGIRSVAGHPASLRFYSNRALASLGDARPHDPEALPPDAIDLTLAAPRFDLVPMAAMRVSAERRGAPPPFGLTDLRSAIANRLTREQGFDHAQDEVVITGGVSGAWSLTLDAFVNPGDVVVLFDPASPLYRTALKQRGARIRWVPTWLEEGKTRFFVQHLADALRGARMLVVNVPANPTGGILSPDDLEQIAWWTDRRDVLLFDDQAYSRFHYGPVPPPVGTLARARRRTLAANSVSMSHALVAARVGWLVGPRELVEPCARAAVGHGLSVATGCQQLALKALEMDETGFAAILADFDARRLYTCERLQALGLPPSLPTGGFTCWVPVGSLGVTGTQLAAALARRRVLVTPGEAFGPSGAGHIRISYAADDGRLREGLRRLAGLVTELRKGRPVNQKSGKKAA